MKTPIASAAALCVCLPCLADVVTLTPSKDNSLYLTDAGEVSNGAGNGIFAGTTALHFPPQFQEVRRGVFSFHVAQAIPAGSVVTRVEVTLTCTMTRGIAADFSLHRVLADWGEGTSVAQGGGGGGAPATPGDCTWTRRFFPGVLWGRPGGDFQPAASDTVNILSLGAYRWGSTPRLVADVQAWLDNPESNFGWLIKSTDEINAANAKRFDSRESPTPSARPQLTVEFTPPCYADCDPGTGVGVLDIFDFLCFQNRYDTLDPYACDCDTTTGPGVCDIFDFLCFQNAYDAGCP